MNTFYASIDTPLGEGFVVFTGKGVASLDTETTEQRFIARATDAFGEPPVKRRLPDRLKRGVAQAISGDTAQAPVDLSRLPEFQRKVLKATMAIPPGRVISYGALAKKVGHPGAARAVGTAMARNPIPLMIPCHRVVKGDGTLGSYGLGGPVTKRLLLEREGVTLP